MRVAETTVAVWTLQVKPNNKANFQITREVLLCWFLPIITFQMHHQQINRTLRRNRLMDPSPNLSLINSHLEPKNTDREISMGVLEVLRFLAQASPTLTCKFYNKKAKKENNSAHQTWQTTHSLTWPWQARKRNTTDR